MIESNLRSRGYRSLIVKRVSFLGLAIAASLVVIFTGFQGVGAENSEASLAPLQVHPLPPSLAQWQDISDAGDYFWAVKPSPVGYLVWSEFPIKVYVERPANPRDSSASDRRFQKWVDAVVQVVQEWGVYLPMVEVEQPELADIVIERSHPPLKATINRETGRYDIPRARSAQTSYKFYLRQDNPPVLSHRMTIEISPSQSNKSILAATRHELGHALGIWGHSPLETDALYFSQVRDSPPISPRDINTLKKIYQQPTRLGWALSVNN